MDVIHESLLDDPLPVGTNLGVKYVDAETVELKSSTLKNLTLNRGSWRNTSHYNYDVKKRVKELVSNAFARHPSDFAHALLSAHVYNDSKVGDCVWLEESEETWNEVLSSWRVCKVFTDEASGFYGAAYLNKDEKQVVLVYRGTTLKFWDLFKSDSPLKNDIDGILANNIVSHQKNAYAVTEEVVQYAREKGYIVSFAGHSLGAWLAELSLFHAVYDFSHLQCKAVTFDSPGSARAMDNFQSNVRSIETERNIRNLEITTYLSAPNLVNVCNPHIGKVYRIYPKIPLAESTDEFAQRIKRLFFAKHLRPFIMGVLSICGHSIKPIVAVFNSETGKPVNFKKVLDWPCLKYKSVFDNAAIERRTNKTIPLSIFQFFPGVGRLVYEVISKPTFLSVLDVIDNFLRLKNESGQFFEVYKYLKINSKEGIPLGGDISLCPEKQFHLQYVAHYRLEILNLSEDTYNDSKISDWYLNKLCQLAIEEIARKEIDVDLKEKLTKLKGKYKIKTKFPSGLKYICAESSIQVDDLREEIIRICETYHDAKEIFENKNAHCPSDGNQYPGIQSCVNFLPKNIIKRPKICEEIEKKLNQHQVLVISGFNGIGKSTMAKIYGCHLKKKCAKQIVRYINADSFDKINAAYKQIAEIELEMRVEGESPAKIMHLVHNRLAKSRTPVLFILDNVNEYEHIKEYLGEISNIENSKVIITTRKNNFSNDLECIKLDPFTKEEAKLYIQNSAENRFSQGEVDYLIDKLSHENFVWPYNLSYAVTYLNKYSICSVKHYVEGRRKSKDSTGTFLLLDVIKNTRGDDESKLSWCILQYSAYLDPDFISIDIFKELLSVDEDELKAVVKKLEDVSLMNSIVLRHGQRGLQIHRLVQTLVKRYARENKNRGRIMGEKYIFKRLIQVLNNMFPNVTSVQNEDWQVSEVLYLHVVKISQCKIRHDKEAELSELIRKLGDYIQIVKLDLDLALTYYKKSLELKQKLNNDHDNEVCIGTLLKEIGDVLKKLGSREDALKYHEDALAMMQTAHRDQNHADIAECFSCIGCDLIELKREEEGFEYYEKALKVIKTLVLKQEHSDLTPFARNVMKALALSTGTAKSRKYFEGRLETVKPFYSKPDKFRTTCTRAHLEIMSKIHAVSKKELKYRRDESHLGRAQQSTQNHPDIALNLDNLGSTYAKLGDGLKSLKYFENALKMRQKLYSHENHPDIARSLDNLGKTHAKLGDNLKSLEYLENALNMKRKLYTQEDHPDIAASFDKIGWVYGNLGNYEQELKYRDNALKMRKILYHGRNNPDVVTSLGNLCLVYAKLRDNIKAVQYLEMALNMRRELYCKQDHPDSATHLDNSTAVYEELGGGVKCNEEALEPNDMQLSSCNHPKIASCFNALGLTYAKLGDYTTALEHLTTALNMRRKAYLEQNHADISTSLDNFGLVYGKIGYNLKELKYHEDALKMKRTLYYGKNHPDVGKSLCNLGFAYQRFGDIKKSDEYFKQAYLINSQIPDTVDIIECTDSCIERNDLKFIKNNETREFILERGNFDESVLQIKQRLQTSVLNQVFKLSSKGKWSSGYILCQPSIFGDAGVKGYLDGNNLRRQLGILFNYATLETARMLCFEAVCLAIMRCDSENRNFECVEKFAEAYPKTMDNIISNHPEYFVDGSVLRHCIDDPDILHKLLGHAHPRHL